MRLATLCRLEGKPASLGDDVALETHRTTLQSVAVRPDDAHSHSEYLAVIDVCRQMLPLVVRAQPSWPRKPDSERAE